MNCTTNKLIKYSKAFKKKETKGTEDISRLIRVKERLAPIRPKDDGFFVGTNIFFPPMAPQPSSRSRPPHYRGFTIILRHTTLGRTPLDECSARRRDLYLTPHNNHDRQTDRHDPGVIRTRLRQCGHWDRQSNNIG